MSQAITFRPHQGLMSLARQLSNKAGLGHMFDGPDGIGSVIDQVLTDAGVPKSVPLTPRAVAERAGIVKKSRRKKKASAVA